MAREYPTGECRSCGARIIWAVTATTGARMPIDVQPITGGTLRLVVASDGAVVAFNVPERVRKGELFVSHFATCPDADQWRSGRE